MIFSSRITQLLASLLSYIKDGFDVKPRDFPY